MQVTLQNLDKHGRQDTEALKREVESLRRQFAENPTKTKQQLAWDTQLLVKKTQNLSSNKIVSCSDPNWRQTIERMHIGAAGIRVNDIRTVEHIEFVAAFAARRQLLMTYANHCFLLEPRQTAID